MMKNKYIEKHTEVEAVQLTSICFYESANVPNWFKDMLKHEETRMDNNWTKEASLRFKGVNEHNYSCCCIAEQGDWVVQLNNGDLTCMDNRQFKNKYQEL